MIQTPRSCKRKSCCYHTGGKLTHGCNYIFVTGVSKTSQMPYGEKYTIENCPFYKKGKRRSASRASPVANPNTVEVIRETMRMDKGLADKLFNDGLCDSDIAMFLNVSVQAIAKWRRQYGYKRKNSDSGHLRRVKWDDVDAMLNEGYSDTAVASYVYTTVDVIQMYKDLMWKDGKGRNETN